jgi:hypothetical protein
LRIPDKPPRRKAEDRELTRRDQEMTNRGFVMDRFQHVARQGLPEFCAKRAGVLTVMTRHRQISDFRFQISV